jgi:hypothetical protein
MATKTDKIVAALATPEGEALQQAYLTEMRAAWAVNREADRVRSVRITEAGEARDQALLAL